MSIFIDKNTRLLIQGITGRDGSFHARQMIEYGTQVVGGVTPGKGGQKFEDEVPVFNTVVEAVKKTGANATVIAGYGYTGILVAFLARQNPLAIIPVAILLGGIRNHGGG